MKPDFCLIILSLTLTLACIGCVAGGPTATPVLTFDNPPPEEAPKISLTDSVPAPPDPHRRCGDGFCDGPESPTNCPVDCLDPISPTPPTLPTPRDVTPAPVLNLGIMVHLEGWEDDKDQARFERHVQLIRSYADLFERYGAKLTLESKELTDGSLRWGENVLLEMEQRGHGIGVHADIGGQRAYDCSRFTADLRRERLQLESLGVTVRHVSGNTSHCDWVTATIEAGYRFTSGQVAYNVMSLPVEKRPEEYRDCPNPAKCHQTFPPELADRLHPWRSSSGADWLNHDPEGELVILSASQGLTCMEEELSGEIPGQCTFDSADLEAFFGELDRALALAQPDLFNIYYVGWSLGSPIDEGLLETWLQRIQPYVERGQVQWMTLPEMYSAYIQWENNR